jgi:hypothetical protein
VYDEGLINVLGGITLDESYFVRGS